MEDTVGASYVEGVEDVVEDKDKAVAGFDMVAWRLAGPEGHTEPSDGSDEGLVDTCRSLKSCYEYNRFARDNVGRAAFLRHILADQVVGGNSRSNRSRPQLNQAAEGAVPFAQGDMHLAEVAPLCVMFHGVQDFLLGLQIDGDFGAPQGLFGMDRRLARSLAVQKDGTVGQKALLVERNHSGLPDGLLSSQGIFRREIPAHRLRPLRIGRVTRLVDKVVAGRDIDFASGLC